MSDGVKAFVKTGPENQTHRLYRPEKLNLAALRRRRARRPGPAVPDNLFRHDSRVVGPDRVCVNDITEQPTSEGKDCIGEIEDMWSRRVNGWATSDEMT